MARITGKFVFSGEEVHTFGTTIDANADDVMGGLVAAINSAKEESDRYLTERINKDKTEAAAKRPAEAPAKKGKAAKKARAK